MRRVLLFIFAGALLATGLPAAAQDHRVLTVYDDTLAAGWLDGSWFSSVALDAPLYTSGSRTIRAQFDEPWAGLSLRNVGAPLAPDYDRVRFMVNGGPEGGQVLSFFFVGADEVLVEGISMTLPPNTWLPVEVPVSIFGSAEQIAALIWHDRMGSAQPAFYIDDVAFVATGQEAVGTAVSDARFARLAKGVNLPMWFWINEDDVPTSLDVYREEDFAAMRRLGLTHVRLPLTMDDFWDWNQADKLNRDHLPILDEAIRRVVSQGLAIIVDLHLIVDPWSQPNPTHTLETDAQFQEWFVTFWRSLAGHLAATTDPERVFLEPLNEPIFEQNGLGWLNIQNRVVTAMRAAAPEHTILITSNRWSSRESFVRLIPLADRNVVYNFHFYDPFVFTHQGADWTEWPALIDTFNAPYPSSPERVAALLGGAGAETVALLTGYGEERWDAGRIVREISAVSAWATRHSVRVTANEFGVYMKQSPDADRVQWLRDVRTTLEGYGFGWAVWGEWPDFGVLGKDEAGNLIIDPETAAALGLG